MRPPYSISCGVADELAPLDDIESIITVPQRDGDGGDLSQREKHINEVLRALLHAPDGLTDEELSRGTGIFQDSAKGCRANLMRAGWVAPLDVPKRPSVNNRPMTVWGLSPAARERLTQGGSR